MVAKILGNLSHGLVFIVSAPAGTGKTTLVRMLINEFDCVAESVSCTTRKIRPGEIPGRDYFFLTDEEFEEKKKSGDFLEFAEVFEHQYGTSREYVMKSQSAGKHVFLVIDTQGAMRLKKENYPAVYVFLSPPSLEELKQRLCKRQTECPDTIEKRLSWAEQEMEMARHYDYHIVNDNLENAYTILRSIVIAEEHRVRP
ncbi:MAG: guanylate kinase [Parachlamydiales bacterium]|nr:guanylate kinase [Verrucomicrobiota bacterium]MBX3719963.1 guanylate kinase [Candidatus Acheromyda pituitae]